MKTRKPTVGLRRIPIPQRMRLAEMIRDARQAMGWTAQQLAMRATAKQRHSEELLYRGGMEPVEVTHRHVQALEDARTSLVMSTTERRARMFGIVAALGLNADEVNLIAGGIPKPWPEGVAP